MKKDQTLVHCHHFKKEWAKLVIGATKYLILMVCNAEKIINVRYDAVRFSNTLHEQFFSLVQLVNCKISFIWIVVLWKQVDDSTVYLSCIMYLHKYFCYFCCFCLTFFNQYYFKKKNALFSNTIEMIYSGDVFEAVQSTNPW